jgi:hypothetical protein
LNNNESLNNCGIFTANISNHSKQRTFVVIGVGRGGTSMVAGILSKLGINMGKLSGITFEDVEIRNVTRNFPKEEWMKNLQPIFERKNEQFDVWGFKVPKFAKFLSELGNNLRNPYFIFVFRDPVAIAIRNVVSVKMDFSYSIKHTLSNYKLFADFIDSTDVPLIAISYEKSIVQPEFTVRKLVEHLGLDATEDMIIEAIEFITPSPDEYVNVEPKK